VLWIIGLTEAGEIRPLSGYDTATWLAQIRAEFEGLAPSLLADLHVPVGPAEEVIALLFDAQRVPYVTKAQPHSVYEVPWREGTAIRSARRHELLSVLATVSQAPELEVLRAAMSWPEPSGSPASTFSRLTVSLYVTPPNSERVTIPFHKCDANLTVNGLARTREGLGLSVPQPGSLFGGGVASLLEYTPRELIIHGPGAFDLWATFSMTIGEAMPTAATVLLSLLPAGSRAAAVVDFNLVSAGGALVWPHTIKGERP
jgi:hypothetical protein